MKRSITQAILISLMAVSLCGCAFSDLLPTVATPSEPAPTAFPTFSAATETPTEAVTEDPEKNEPFDAVSDLINSMTLREKVGQLFIIRPDSLDLSKTQEQINDAKSDGVTAMTVSMQATLERYPVGGVVMFGKNMLSPSQITRFNADLQSVSSIPLFICVDEEGGSVSRLANSSAFDLPTFGNAALIQSSADALNMGQTIGAYLAEYGFNLDFAPVADVNTNPDNPIIGTRAFSSDPEAAAEKAAAMAQGLADSGIIATYKHFPGHGDTAEDSHLGLAVSYKTYAEMEDCEWVPFRRATASDCVMVGHIATPEITGDLTPASMSHALVTETLKNTLNFQGLVVTDSLAMEAITDTYSPGEAALTALNAGCDLLLMPNGLCEAFDAVVEAVENGTYSEAALDATVARILRFKLDHDLLSFG